MRLIRSRYCWPGMDKQIKHRTKICCIPCQCTKVFKHTVSPIMSFAPSDRRFGHIHGDLIGPLFSSNSCWYFLTCIDRFTRWLEAWPIDNMLITIDAIDISFWRARRGHDRLRPPIRFILSQHIGMCISNISNIMYYIHKIYIDIHDDIHTYIH